METSTVTFGHIIFLVLQVVILQMISRTYLETHQAGQLGKFIWQKPGEFSMHVVIGLTFVFHLYWWAKEPSDTRTLFQTFGVFLILGLRVLQISINDVTRQADTQKTR
jgi:hypothetical protein